MKFIIDKTNKTVTFFTGTYEISEIINEIEFIKDTFGEEYKIIFKEETPQINITDPYINPSPLSPLTQPWDQQITYTYNHINSELLKS